MEALKNFFKNFFNYENDDKLYHFEIPETQEEKDAFDNSNGSSGNNSNSSNLTGSQDQQDSKTKSEPTNVFPSLNINLEFMKAKYNTSINSDIVIREFTLTARNKQFSAFLMYIDGMVDSKMINDFVLQPLMLKNRANLFDGEQSKVVSEAVTNNITVRKVKRFDLVDYIFNSLMPQNSVEKVNKFEEVCIGINAGNCVLFIDTIPTVFNIEVKGFKQRSVEKPENEMVIRGSQEGFTEVIRTNTSLIRKCINNENLIIESTNVGKLSRTPCAICYINGIANDALVNEVKNRVNNLDIDYLTSSGQLEQLIEDNGNISLPQLIATERPDKASNFLMEGRVVIIVNGSPYSLVAPATFMDFITSPEDTNLKYQFANMLKILRVLAVFIALLLPGFYIAITSFHQELIPTELLFSIVASRESVPFPILFEILMMEISFELIREAGLRAPSTIGPTVGIIGAIIIGQAAVDANLVSPLLIIIIAITGLASFAITDFSFSFYCRLLRFVYILLGYFMGFLGICIGLFVQLLIICNLKSFGAPYLQPYVPVTTNYRGLLFSPAWKRENRADFLNVKRQKRLGKISMKWKNSNNVDNGG